MRKNVGVFAGLIVGLAIAIGVAQSSHEAAAETVALDDVVIVSVSEADVDGALFLPDKQGRITCANGTAPRCYRDECPSDTECPATDQCYGSLTCGLYTTVWKGGKQGCRMYGDCAPPASGGPIVIP